MSHDYDIFEKLPDGALVWRNSVSGYYEAMHKLKELAAETSNEVRLMDLKANAVIAAMNETLPSQASRVSDERDSLQQA